MLTKTTVLPFLTTHIANIALNKQIGLVFLLEDAQNTCGFSDVSEESLVSDQLHVGAWMIASFGRRTALSVSEEQVEPWTAFKPFDMDDVTDHVNIDKDGLKNAADLVEQIDAERMALGDQLWNLENGPSLKFLQRVVAQVQECVAYTATRVDAIKVCSQVDPSSPEALFESLTSHGTDLGLRLLSKFSGLGLGCVGAMGYLRIKHTITPPMVFTRRFVEVVRRVVEDKAISEGYIKPLAE